MASESPRGSRVSTCGNGGLALRPGYQKRSFTAEPCMSDVSKPARKRGAKGHFTDELLDELIVRLSN